MTMTMSRRPARKSELNLDSIPPNDASCRLSNGFGAESATGKRRRSWFWFSIPPILFSTPLTPASLCRPSALSRLLLYRSNSYLKRSNPIHVAIFGVIFLSALIWLINYIGICLVGPRWSTKGGFLGNVIDQYSKDYIRYKTISKWREEVQSLRLSLGELEEPSFYPFDMVIRSRPNYAIVEMLLREKRRVQKLKSIISSTKTIGDKCSRDENSLVYIPETDLQLLHRHEQSPLPPYWIVRSSSIDIDSIAISNSDINRPLSQAVESCQDFSASNRAISTHTDLQCVAHHLGGMQMSNSFMLYQSRQLMSNIFSYMALSKTNQLGYNLGGGTCNSRLGYAVFSNVPTPDNELKKTSSVSSHVSTVFAAFPPGHPGSLCIPPLEQPIGISPYNEANEELSFRSTFANKLLTEMESRNSNSTDFVWGVATLPCDIGHSNEDAKSNCCNQVSVTILDSMDAGGIAKQLKNERPNNKLNHHLIFTSSKLTISTHEQQTSINQPSKSVSVSISERPYKTKGPRRKKISIQTELRNRWRCEPGWFCNRCLQSSIYGSFSNCASVCSKCAVNVICNEAEALSSMERVKIDVQVTRNHLPTGNKLMANVAPQNRIPRIIHQTYFEEITIEKYPQLFRLQNTWRSSGWEYRFYTDDTARQYIESNYPSRFVSVFDSLLPGAYKADFFRYLVLYKEGGLYADVDMMLNTNLDSFITPDLAFWAPIDAVGNFADEPFCVWNGLLGSAPAHPALTNVINWMVNLVSHRGDQYDMEQVVCRYSGIDKIENWKVRAEPSLLLSGPCALGLAVNNALGNEPLSKFRAGLLKREGFNEKNIQDLNADAIGNILFLVADKDDLGAFRFSDPERNIMVASTELAGLSKAPLAYEDQSTQGRKGLRQKPHYSVSTKGMNIWGTRDVYVDDLDLHEHVSIIVSHK